MEPRSSGGGPSCLVQLASFVFFARILRFFAEFAVDLQPAYRFLGFFLQPTMSDRAAGVIAGGASPCSLSQGGEGLLGEGIECHGSASTESGVDGDDGGEILRAVPPVYGRTMSDGRGAGDGSPLSRNAAGPIPPRAGLGSFDVREVGEGTECNGGSLNNGDVPGYKKRCRECIG